MKNQFIFKIATAGTLMLALTQNSRSYASDPGMTEATNYRYLPGASLVLGQGFSIESPLASTTPCIVNAPTFKNPSRNVSQDGNVEVTVVQSNSALKVVLGIDTSMDASALSFSGSESLEFNSEVDITENDATVVIHGSSVYSNDLLDTSNLQYTPNALAFINARDFDGFRKLCGQQLITGVTYGTDVAIVISIKGLSDQERLSINASASGSGGFGPISGSAKTAINSLLTHSSDRVSISMKAFVRGGNGLPDFQGLVTEVMNPGATIQSMTSGVASVFQSLTADRAAVTGFTTQPYPGVTPEDENLITPLKTNYLETLNTLFRGGNAKYMRLQEDFTQWDLNCQLPRDFETVAGSTLSGARVEMPALASYLKAVADAHEACVMEKSSNFTSCISPRPPIIPNINSLYWELTMR